MKLHRLYCAKRRDANSAATPGRRATVSRMAYLDDDNPSKEFAGEAEETAEEYDPMSADPEVAAE